MQTYDIFTQRPKNTRYTQKYIKKPLNMQILEKTKNLLRLQNYSPKTIKTYLFFINDYLTFAKSKKIKNKTKAIEAYLLEKQNQKKSPQTINLALNAIKFLYHKVLKSKKEINFRCAKKAKKLPIVLSKKEIKKILDTFQNLKHKLAISLGYAAGLRVSEVTALKIKDLNLEELTLHIKNAKGKKDRITIFPKKLIPEIQNLIADKKGNNYIFESNRGGKLTTTSLQKIFKKALKKSKIQKDATFHSLRHSFATHLLEDNIDIRYVQELLGHANIRTTQIYTKVTNPKLKNIKSPLQ